MLAGFSFNSKETCCTDFLVAEGGGGQKKETYAAMSSGYRFCDYFSLSAFPLTPDPLLKLLHCLGELLYLCSVPFQKLPPVRNSLEVKKKKQKIKQRTKDRKNKENGDSHTGPESKAEKRSTYDYYRKWDKFDVVSGLFLVHFFCIRNIYIDYTIYEHLVSYLSKRTARGYY